MNIDDGVASADLHVHFFPDLKVVGRNIQEE